jgi:AbrB family looped-hinge helix DNA binding protein
MKVTTKGQVTIPARIREYLGIAPHSDVDFRISGGTVVLVKHEETDEPGAKFAALRGVLKGTRTTREWMRATRGN